MRARHALAVALLALALPGSAQASARAEAEQALDEALAVFAPKAGTATAESGPRDATLVLRDLAARLDDLSAGDRKVAERILARPTDGFDPYKRYAASARHVCDATTCIWWVSRTADAPSPADRNRNGVPDWVDTTRATFRAVWAAEVGRYGYARPLADARGPRGRDRRKLDVYVADLGSRGIYGYCTTDDPRRTTSRSVSAYCAVDDDFSRAQFGGGTTGVAALKVTAAHEFFHAVQYAYDWLDDLWLMEGSAAWVESEVYPRIRDNLQYLRRSPLSSDAFFHALDHDEPNGSRPETGLTYGAWIWWRFLSERHGRGIVRDVWSRARGATYAIQATEAALAARGEPFGLGLRRLRRREPLPGRVLPRRRPLRRAAGRRPRAPVGLARHRPALDRPRLDPDAPPLERPLHVPPRQRPGRPRQARGLRPARPRPRGSQRDADPAPRRTAPSSACPSRSTERARARSAASTSARPRSSRRPCS